MTKTVTKQPLQWVQKPAAGNCSPGLEYFTGRPQMHLKQKIDVLEMVVGWEQTNKFRITDPQTGEVIGMFKEQSGMCARQCCKNGRGFKAQVVDAQGDVIFKMIRPFKCSFCGGFCCECEPDSCCASQQIYVYDRNDNKLGSVIQGQGVSGLGWIGCCCYCDWNLSLKDVKGNEQYIMRNDVCSLSCGCDDKHLPITRAGGLRVGALTKKWRGCATECCTIADALLIDFPNDADEAMKAVIVAACLLSDYNIWERQD